MSTQIQFNEFNFNSRAIRVIVDQNQEPWFCGNDVCDILGYTNSRKALQDHCKAGGVTKRYTPTKSGDQEMIFINEPNLYRLIIKSRKPEAEPFEAWVFEEVLPQIRKTGKYSVQPQQIALPEPPKTYTRTLTEEQWLGFASLWYCLYNCVELLDKIEKPLNALRSPLGIDARTHVQEYHISLGIAKRLLAPLLAEFDVDPRERHYFHALKTLREYKPFGVGKLARV